MRKTSTIALFLVCIFAGVLFGAWDIEKKLAREPFHLVKFFQKSRTSYVNWSSLIYFASFGQQIRVGKDDNFVQKVLFEKRQLVKRARKDMLGDILQIDINSEMTIKELLEINETFKSSMTRLFFSPEILLPPVQAGYNLTLEGYTTFEGMGGFIDLILKSGYFVEREKLAAVPSRYKPFSYERMIIETRHLSLNPALFPQIYTYDKTGKKVLIYSLAHAQRESITQKGYVRYYSNTDSFNLNDKKNFYCPAMEVVGTKGNDLVISREDYIKFFGSDVSLHHLSRGNLFIITEPRPVDNEKNS